jgi:multiple sugar transport system permease protein
VINAGRNGLELLSVLVYDNVVGEASRIGFGSTLAVILLTVSLAFIIPYLVVYFRGNLVGRDVR